MDNTEQIQVITDSVLKMACRKCGASLDVAGLPSFSTTTCTACGSPQTVPAQLGNFVLLELLGAGGMGAVYMALDQTLGRYVALKVMRRAMSDDPKFVENFLREARAAAAINHRNVVQIYSCGEEKGQPYIVMELVTGKRMDEMIASGQPLDELRALEIGMDVAQGLKAAGDIGLIHGDIKPANILLDKDGTAKVVDFGLARFMHQQTAPGEIWGTPYYIAPEKARGQKVDHRSDIYSLGATLYHALGAKPPFEGTTATDVVVARLKNPAVSLRVIRPNIQPETADLIARMLESDPFLRYPTYPSLLADMREALRVVKKEKVTLYVPGNKHRGLILAGAACAALALVIGLAVHFKSRRGTAGGTVEPAVTSAVAAVTGGTAVTEFPPVQTQAPPAVAVAPLQPFTPEDEKQLLQAMQGLSQGRPVDTKDQLGDLYARNKLPLARTWIRWMQSIPALVSGFDEKPYLRDAIFFRVDPVPENQPQPADMPRLLANYLLNNMDDATLDAEAAKWPNWYVNLADFTKALHYLYQKNDLARAAEGLTRYLNAKGEDPIWPYALQPAARFWLDQINRWNEQETNVTALIAVGKYLDARKQLEIARSGGSVFLAAPINRIKSRIRELEKSNLSTQRQEELRRQQAVVQQDLDLLDGARADNLAAVSQKDFRGAGWALARVRPQLKTLEGQQVFRFLSESYTRMDDLKKFLTERLDAAPYPNGAQTELRGAIIGANPKGIRVGLGQHGELLRPWDQVSINLFVQLSAYYLQDTAQPAGPRADQLLSLAVFCYENAGFKPAGVFTAEALKLDPALKEKARQLMPDIVPD